MKTIFDDDSWWWSSNHFRSSHWKTLERFDPPSMFIEQCSIIVTCNLQLTICRLQIVGHNFRFPFVSSLNVIFGYLSRELLLLVSCSSPSLNWFVLLVHHRLDDTQNCSQEISQKYSEITQNFWFKRPLEITKKNLVFSFQKTLPTVASGFWLASSQKCPACELSESHNLFFKTC